MQVSTDCSCSTKNDLKHTCQRLMSLEERQRQRVCYLVWFAVFFGKVPFRLQAFLARYKVQAVKPMMAAVSSTSTPTSIVSVMHALSKQASSEQASSEQASSVQASSEQASYEQASSEQGQTALAWSISVQRTLCQLPWRTSHAQGQHRTALFREDTCTDSVFSV